MAGFPFSSLEALGSPRAAALVREALATEQERDNALEQALQVVRRAELPDDKQQRELFLKLQRALIKRKPPFPLPPSALVDQLTPLLQAASREEPASAWVAAEAAAVAELLASRQALLAFCTSPRMRHALFLVNPGAERQVLPETDFTLDAKRNSKVRQRERFLALHAQRVCSKNETNSFFGPSAPGRVDGNHEPTFRLEAEGPSHSSVHVAHWIAQSLANAAHSVPSLKAHFRALRNPSAVLIDSRVEWDQPQSAAPGAWAISFTRKSLELDPDAWRVLGAADGSDIPTIALRAGLSVDETTEWLEALAEPGLVELGILIGCGLIDPMPQVLAVLSSLSIGANPGAALNAGACEIDASIRRFPNAPLDERRLLLNRINTVFEQLTGESSTRHAGQLYADRMALSEDSRAPITAPRITGQLFEKNAPALDAICAMACLRLEARRAHVRLWYLRRFEMGRRISFREVEDLAERDGVLDATAGSGPAVEALRSIAELFSSAVAPGRGEVQISSAEILARCALAPSAAYYLPVDFLIQGPAAKARLVIGEIQYGFFVANDFFLDSYTPLERAEFQRGELDLLRRLAGDLPLADVVRPHGSKIDLRYPILDHELLMNVPGCRPQLGCDRVLRLSQTEVQLDGAGVFHFYASGVEEFVPVMRLGCHALLQTMLPVVAGMAYPENFPPPGVLSPAVLKNGPRITVDDVVVRRRTVAVPRELFLKMKDSSATELLAGASRICDRFGLGRYAFAKVPGERKPLLFDAHSPLLLDPLRHMVANCESDADISMSEMLPGPEELVLSGPEGLRTSEIRMCLFRPRT